eukprot:TRINITY_DN954_c0_g1_i1.p1 TRINITY_DN954_c0_g1~~TRINITY_DN954_c0_g1_i1.p1  ORF type:complete len:721 (+),score=239.91 TRINITY_DN954_c0_g1_i1:195-2357(+)
MTAPCSLLLLGLALAFVPALAIRLTDDEAAVQHTDATRKPLPPAVAALLQKSGKVRRSQEAQEDVEGWGAQWAGSTGHGWDDDHFEHHEHDDDHDNGDGNGDDGADYGSSSRNPKLGKNAASLLQRSQRQAQRAGLTQQAHRGQRSVERSEDVEGWGAQWAGSTGHGWDDDHFEHHEHDDDHDNGDGNGDDGGDYRSPPERADILLETQSQAREGGRAARQLAAAGQGRISSREAAPRSKKESRRIVLQDSPALLQQTAKARVAKKARAAERQEDVEGWGAQWAGSTGHGWDDDHFEHHEHDDDHDNGDGNGDDGDGGDYRSPPEHGRNVLLETKSRLGGERKPPEPAGQGLLQVSEAGHKGDAKMTLKAAAAAKRHKKEASAAAQKVLAEEASAAAPDVEALAAAILRSAGVNSSRGGGAAASRETLVAEHAPAPLPALLQTEAQERRAEEAQSAKQHKGKPSGLPPIPAPPAAHKAALSAAPHAASVGELEDAGAAATTAAAALEAAENAVSTPLASAPTMLQQAEATVAVSAGGAAAIDAASVGSAAASEGAAQAAKQSSERSEEESKGLTSTELLARQAKAEEEAIRKAEQEMNEALSKADSARQAASAMRAEDEVQKEMASARAKADAAAAQDVDGIGGLLEEDSWEELDDGALDLLDDDYEQALLEEEAKGKSRQASKSKSKAKGKWPGEGYDDEGDGAAGEHGRSDIMHTAPV